MLGMKGEKKDKLFCFGGTSAERSKGVYNGWGQGEPSYQRGENCAYIGSNAKWDDNP